MSFKSLPSTWGKKPRRRKNGQFARKLKGVGVVSAMVLSVFAMRGLEQMNEHDQLMKQLYPVLLFRQPDPELPQLVGQAKAKEIETPTASASPSIEDRIRMRFQGNGDKAVAISKCESGMRDEAHGDKSLMVYDSIHDEMVGDSLGMFQIRTGGKEKNGSIWNRARANGMSADEFRTALKESNFNMEQAYRLSNGGKDWSGWRICQRKLGL